jgi:hypothetical protein
MKREIESEDKESKKSQHNEINQIIIKFPENVLNLLLLMGNDILRKLSKEIIERLFAKYSIKFSSCLVSELLKQEWIDIRGNIIIPRITADQIIFLTNPKDIERNFGFLIIRNNLHRIKSDIRIAISNKEYNSRFICFLIGKLLKIFYTEKKCVTDSRSEKIFYRRKIPEIHGM